MLVLSRKVNESLVIGDNITITVVRVKGQVVRIGVEAPPHVPVRRAEIPAAETKTSGGDPPPAPK